MPDSADVVLQSYFEARSNIRELEQRQFSTIQFFLGAYAAVMGGSIGLMQYVDPGERPFLAVAFVLLSNVLSVCLFFSWCSITLMIDRAALYCVDIIDRHFRAQRDAIWETWLGTSRNTSSLPYLLESTLLVFLLPVVASFGLSLYFAGQVAWVPLVWVGVLVTLVGIALLLLQYRWVRATWARHARAPDAPGVAA